VRARGISLADGSSRDIRNTSVSSVDIFDESVTIPPSLLATRSASQTDLGSDYALLKSNAGINSVGGQESVTVSSFSLMYLTDVGVLWCVPDAGEQIRKLGKLFLELTWKI
jgi:hypothetical protein